MNGLAGNNTVMFKEIGNSANNGLGMIIGNVSLTCTFIANQPSPPPSPSLPAPTTEPTSAELNILPIFFSALTNQIVGLKYVYLLAEDIWLYYYDKEDY